MAMQAVSDFEKALRKKTQAPEIEWWRQDGRDLATGLFNASTLLLAQQDYRFRAYGIYRKMFQGGTDARNQPMMSSGWAVGSYPRRLAFNLIASIINTLVAKIASDPIRISFQTSGGTWSQQKKAKMLERYTDGQFYWHEMDKRTPLTFRSACVFGTGATNIQEFQGKLRVRNLHTTGLLVDDMEGLNQKPPQMLYVDSADKHQLAGMFPKHKKAIMAAKMAVPQWSNRTISQQVDVVEGWRLPSALDAKDGRYVIAIDDTVLYDEPWVYDYYPTSFLRYEDPLEWGGFWGTGIAERLLGYQFEVNRVTRCIQLSHHFISVPKVWVENGANVVLNEVNNQIGAIIRYTGIKPIVEAANAVSPELVQYLLTTIQQAFQESGISMQSAGGQKTPGLDSGAALRTQVNIESERFKPQGRAVERYLMTSADLMLDATRDLHEKGVSVKVQVPGSKFTQEIDWSEIDAERNEYVIQAYPTSLLPKTPEGKLQFVTDLLGAGMISAEMGRKLMSMPDLETFFSLANASIDDIMAAIERMQDGEYEKPEPFQDLQKALQMVQSAYLEGRAAGQDDEQLDPFLRYMSDCQDMIAEANQAAQQAAMAAQQAGQAGAGGTPPLGGPPQAGPQGAPTSPMLPPRIPPAGAPAAG